MLRPVTYWSKKIKNVFLTKSTSLTIHHKTQRTLVKLYNIRNDTTQNRISRRWCKKMQPPRPKPVWVDSFSEKQMRDGSCHRLTRAAGCSAGFGRGALQGSRSLCCDGDFGTLLAVRWRFLIWQLFGHYKLWRTALCNGGAWTCCRVLCCWRALSEQEKSIYTPLYVQYIVHAMNPGTTRR